MDGGYDEGYKRCACFWGNKPGKLVEQYLLKLPEGTGMTALDLGCGEGKNAIALANAGFHVTAVDCSNAALETQSQTMVTQKLLGCRPTLWTFYATPRCMI